MPIAGDPAQNFSANASQDGIDCAKRLYSASMGGALADKRDVDEERCEATMALAAGMS